MKNIAIICAMVMVSVSVIAVGTLWAGTYTGAITAEEAFDAVVNQVDPDSRDPAVVRIVDIRTKAEYYWVGRCGRVTEIKTTRGLTFEPDKGKVKLRWGGRFLAFRESGIPRFLHIKRVDDIEVDEIKVDGTSAVVHIPYQDWDEELCDKPPNNNFVGDIQALADLDSGNVVIILMCRSGKRTSACVTDIATSLFKAVYEIDNDPNPNSNSDGNLGGFQGSSFGDVYNGYRGFPERKTSFQDHESVSWYDSGLPIKIGKCP